MKGKMIAICLIAGFALPCLAQELLTQAALDTAAKLRQQALTGHGGYEVVESLTVEVGARRAGTPADRAAVAWAEAKLNELEFDRVWKEEVTFPYWIRGEALAEVVSPFPQSLSIIALGNSVGTPDEGIEAEVLEVAAYEDLANLDPARAAGKIVFINKRMERHKTGSGYGAAVVARSSGASAAARLGAVGLVIRSIGTDSHRFPHTGVMRYEEDVRKIPAAALSNPDADQLGAMIARGKPVRLRLFLSSRDGGMATSYNVIGEIRGREKPEEVVVIGAHLDSWDQGTGAIDDGAGVGIVVGAAKLIANLSQRPRRTVRVVLFANEESGLFGGRAYAQAHANDLANHIIGAESDFGAGRIWQVSSLVAENALPAFAEIGKALAPLGIAMGDNMAGGGPDLSPIRALGMPVATLQQDGTDYFDYHHTADDTLDKIDPQALAQNVAAYAVFAYLAAEIPTRFGPLVQPAQNSQ